MSILTVFGLAWKSVTARLGRSLGAVAGLALGIAMYVAASVLSQGYADLVRQPLAQMGSDATVQKPGPPVKEGAAVGVSLPPGNFPLSPQEVENISGLAAVETALPAMLIWERSPAGFVLALGFDPQGPRYGGASAQGWVVQGRPLENAGEVLLEKHFAKLHRKKVSGQWPLGGRPFTIAGTVEVKAAGLMSTINVFISLDEARALAGQPSGAANLVFLRLKPGLQADAVAKRLAEVLPGSVLTSADSIGKMMQGFSLISGKFASLIGALALAFAGVVYLRLVKGVLQERSDEVGVMKTLGWRRRDVVQALMAESVILGLGGAFAGVAVGWAAACSIGEMGVSLTIPWSLNPLPAGVGSHGATGMGQTISLPVAFSWLAGGASFCFALLLSAFTGWREGGRMFKATILTSLREL